MTHVWLVIGDTGEYSDHTQWNVACYPTIDAANAHRAAAQMVADQVKNLDASDRRNAKNPHDSQMQCDYTGTRYTVEMIELHEAFTTANS